MESLLNYLVSESKSKMLHLLPWQQHVTDSQIYNSVKSTLIGSYNAF